MPSNTIVLDLIDLNDALTRAAYLAHHVRITPEAHDQLIHWDPDANHRKHLNTAYLRVSETSRTRELLLRVNTQLRARPDQDSWQFPAAVIPRRGTSNQAATRTVHVTLNRSATGDTLQISTTPPSQ